MAWEYFNPNPVQHARGVGDCSVRALAKALSISWEEAYVYLSVSGFVMGDMPNANYIIGAVLRENGFKRKSIPENCPECFTVNDFCEKYPEGVYVVFSQDHVATVVNSVIYDAWDSSENIPQFYWYLDKK